MSWYLDSSAILKLLIAEKESAELVRFINFVPKSSFLARVEVVRTLMRIAPEKVDHAKIILQQMDLSPISPVVLMKAESFASSVSLQTLAAIHIATVQSLHGVIEGLITYDNQMISNAKDLGITVVSPGMK